MHVRLYTVNALLWLTMVSQMQHYNNAGWISFKLCAFVT